MPSFLPFSLLCTAGQMDPGPGHLPLGPGPSSTWHVSQDHSQLLSPSLCLHQTEGEKGEGEGGRGREGERESGRGRGKGECH